MTTIDTHATGAADAGAGLACVADWLTTTDHKRIGRLYVGTSLVALVGSLVVAALLAAERISTSSTIVDLGSLTQLFSVYRFGLTYVVMLPLLLGVAVAVVPLQVGSRAIAFPRTAMSGFWAWLLGAVLAIISIAANGGPNGGNKRFVDLFLLSAILCIGGLLATTVSLATSILTTRTPGMNMRRVPLFTWSVLVMALGLVIALPVVAGDLLILFIGHKYPSLSELSGNRVLGTTFAFGFSQTTTLLFAVPVLGFLAEVVATANRSRTRQRGIVLAGIGLTVSAVFGVALQWPTGIRSGFSSLSGGDKVSDLLPFALVHLLPLLGAFLAVVLTLGSIRKGVKLHPALVFGVLAALLTFDGFLGNALANIGDAGLAGTSFEEGVWLALVYGAVIAGMGALVHWGPKLWGRLIPMKAVLPLALLTFVGGTLASLPMMVAGFADQPGAVFPVVQDGDSVVAFSYSGPASLWNGLAAAGHALVLLSVLAFVALALRSFLAGEKAGDDPWDGLTLEWATTSPAPADNFADLHVVQSAEPLLDLKPSNGSDAR